MQDETTTTEPTPEETSTQTIEETTLIEIKEELIFLNEQVIASNQTNVEIAYMIALSIIICFAVKTLADQLTKW